MCDLGSGERNRHRGRIDARENMDINLEGLWQVKGEGNAWRRAVEEVVRANRAVFLKWTAQKGASSVVAKIRQHRSQIPGLLLNHFQSQTELNLPLNWHEKIT